jgi:hypothetical protein
LPGFLCFFQRGRDIVLEIFGKRIEIIFIKEQCNKLEIDFKEIEKDLKNGLFLGEEIGGDILTFKHEVEKYFKERFVITI